jgi:predicted ArsR family transcriptional regulator
MRVESSDSAVLDLLRKLDFLTVSQLAAAMEVTDTAARQRLNRLMVQGLITRTTAHSRRGRPSHH